MKIFIQFTKKWITRELPITTRKKFNAEMLKIDTYRGNLLNIFSLLGGAVVQVKIMFVRIINYPSEALFVYRHVHLFVLLLCLLHSSNISNPIRTQWCGHFRVLWTGTIDCLNLIISYKTKLLIKLQDPSMPDKIFNNWISW